MPVLYAEMEAEAEQWMKRSHVAGQYIVWQSGIRPVPETEPQHVVAPKRKRHAEGNATR